jgi:hypothetical protein
MTIDLRNFKCLCNELSRIDFFGEGKLRPPWSYPPTKEIVLQAIESGSAELPPAYRSGYLAPLVANLQHLLLQTSGRLEPYTAVIYQYAANSSVSEPLHRFLAVISDLYRSFLHKSGQTGPTAPVATQLPPLALFESVSGGTGPYTITSDDMWNLIGSNIGLVSLPARFQDHPLIWACLAHETGGHDVIHAQLGLLQELREGVWAEFGAKPPSISDQPTPDQLNALVWDHWMDEAASDVYGLLNIGPQFAINLAAYFSAANYINGADPMAEHPVLWADCLEYSPTSGNFRMDEHPPDVLRLHLAMGVIEGLVRLKKQKKDAYIQDLQAVSNAAAPDPQNARTITLRGYVEYVSSDGSKNYHPVHSFPSLADMRESAKRVGTYICKTKLKALGGISIQAIETWDDDDEARAVNIANALKLKKRVDSMGDDAQVLAGATAALVEKPDLYEVVSRLVELALNASFRSDPIWRPSSPAPPASGFSSRSGIKAHGRVRRNPRS